MEWRIFAHWLLSSGGDGVRNAPVGGANAAQCGRIDKWRQHTSAVLTALLARHNKNRDLAEAKSLFRKVSRTTLHDPACKATAICR